MEVQREHAQKMICVCRLKISGGHDSCSVPTSGTDEPVCQWCVASGHDKQDNFDPTIKTTKTVGIGGGVTMEVVVDA